MIIDRISNLGRYGIGLLEPVIEYLDKNNLSELGNGLTVLEGNGLSVNILDRVLEKEPFEWEVHRRFIDVHVMICGGERICCAYESDLAKEREYSEDCDSALFLGNPSKKICYELGPGEAIVFFPGELHLTNGPCNRDRARKAIFKVPIEK